MIRLINCKIFVKGFFLLPVLLLCTGNVVSQEKMRWSLTPEGIQWVTGSRDTHMDHLEMSGFYISAIVHYGVEGGLARQRIQLVFPMLRTIPNDTHASLAYEADNKNLPGMKIDGKPVEEYPESFWFNGVLSYRSKTAGGIEIIHQLFPSTDQAAFFDRVEITNTSGETVIIEIPEVDISDTTDPAKGVYGAYIIKTYTSKNGTFNLGPGESLGYALIYTGRCANAIDKYISPDYELKKRQQLVVNTFSNLVFESPDEVLNRAFAFAKLRAVESIYNTKGGLMHGPGGGRYYAAIWANDQAEYADPFFPFLGNLAGNESAINSFRHFARYMNDEYKPIPSSIIAEGTDFWNGAGDRGDMAMIAYGASRFSLAYGNKNTAFDLWPLITWCLEYCNRKVNSEGVVASDCDELEGRFPAGDANLNTSCLYYDALISSSLLGKELGIDKKQCDNYLERAEAVTAVN